MDLSHETGGPTPLRYSTLLPLLLLSLARQRHSPVISKTFKDEYDYIVVGAGAAGCVVASRLSEKPCVNVLLLEAGEEPPIITEVPGIARYFKKYDQNWQFTTVSQKNAGSGFPNRQFKLESGKMLGGSGSINGMLYVRGPHQDYDNWAAMGAKGWSYRDVFPYFLKLEDNRDFAYLANGYHTVGGPITVEVPRHDSEITQAVYAAAIELGFEIVDYNANKQLGFYAEQGFIRDNQRCNSLKGYIVPVAHRKNLDILTKALVTKVVTKNGKATGVEMLYDGKIQVVKARKEVVVSAGTVNSPRLLLLSGIGPKEDLKKLNIPVVVNLPVGKNLQDSVVTHYPFTLNKRFQVFDEKVSNHSNIMDYINYRKGPLASLTSLTTGFLRCVNESGPADYPDYQIYFYEQPESFGKSLGLKPEVYKQVFGPYEGQAIFSCSVESLAPESRGTITLNSSNPFDPPVIDPNYFQVQADLTHIVQGLRTCKKILNTKPLLKLDAKPLETLVPGCEKYFRNDEEYFKCYAKTISFSNFHLAGTCRMGDRNDLNTVVDPELRVKRIKGLRVIDTSIMPCVTRGNTFIPTVMIAEKASDLIKDDISY